MTDIAELREKDEKALREELAAKLKEQFSLRMQHASGQSVKVHQFKIVRRGIARIKTLLREKTQATEGENK